MKKFKYTEAQKKFVKREIVKLTKILKLDVWDIRIKFSKEANSSTAAASNQVDFEYKNSTITIWPCFF